ncbi:MAG: phage minor capsid protein [Candidatus Fonsibacter sp.]
MELHPIYNSRGSRTRIFFYGDDSEYFGIIVRFTGQTGNTLPVVIPRIANPMQPNITIYTVSLRYYDPLYAKGKEFIATVPIIYEPEDKTTKVQLNPMGGQDLSGTYYHVHNYIHFINLINKAFASALNILRSYMPQNDQGATLIDAAVALYLDFDPTTNRVILHAHQSFFDEVGTTVNDLYNVQIYLNERLYDLFVGLPYEHVSSDGELNYRLRVMYNNNNLVPRKVLIPGTTGTAEPRNLSTKR